MPLNLVFTQPGTFTIDDNGIPGDGISVIRDSNGVVIFTFAHPADALGLTVNTPGVNLIINFTDTLAAADFSIGSLTGSLIGRRDAGFGRDEERPHDRRDVTLVSNSTITEGGVDAAADIIAGDLIMSAVRPGSAPPATRSRPRPAFIEAETITGGINLRNTGSVQIGGLTDQVNGLDVLTSGNLTFTAIGSIFLSDVDLDAGQSPDPPAPIGPWRQHVGQRHPYRQRLHLRHLHQYRHRRGHARRAATSPSTPAATSPSAPSASISTTTSAPTAI